MRALPGITAAALSTGGPFGAWTVNGATLEGRGRIPPSPFGPAILEVTPEYFGTLGSGIVGGRNFDTADYEAGNRVALVNDLMAKHYWPRGDALGKCIRGGGGAAPCMTIIGMVRGTRESAVPQQLAGPPIPTEVYYFPFQTKLSARVNNEAAAWLYVRSVADAPPLAPAVRRVMKTLAPDSPYPDVVAIGDRLDIDFRPWRLGATMFTIFGSAALTLAVVGLYGVLAFRVSERTHDRRAHSTRGGALKHSTVSRRARSKARRFRRKSGHRSVATPRSVHRSVALQGIGARWGRTRTRR